MKHPTQKDVPRRAAVARLTVSDALNNQTDLTIPISALAQQQGVAGKSEEFWGDTAPGIIHPRCHGLLTNKTLSVPLQPLLKGWKTSYLYS
jgi:hypothetical protein